ncbi:MAG: hypothetical protein RSC33_05355, partial [Vagococcus sp.]
ILLLAVLFGVVVAFRIRQKVVERRFLQKLNQESDDASKILVSKLDAIAILLEDKSISSFELQQRSDYIFAEMESLDFRGSLSSSIEATKALVDTEVNARKSA